MPNHNCIVVLGPTASGKTHLACQLAHKLNGEVISADSRQVYQFLNIGTGKDLDEYVVEGHKINYHLIDTVHPSEQYYLHEFISELQSAFDNIIAKHKLPVICGGTGLYLDALRKDFSLTRIKENPVLRKELEVFSKEELIKMLREYPQSLTQQVDLNSKKRLIRGLEIAEHLKITGESIPETKLPYRPFYIGIDVNIRDRKKRISQRLSQRLNKGLIEEVQGLIQMGITKERLSLFGLEYKFVLRYLEKEMSKEGLFTGLETAIFQFAKRQMTWFRKMEKEGVQIHWVNRDVNIDELVDKAFKNH